MEVSIQNGKKMRYTLTLKQEKFLNLVLYMVGQGEIYRHHIPTLRIRNILQLGCYYDDHSSHIKPPMNIEGFSIPNDKEKLNEVAELIRSMHGKKKTVKS
jgi:hypothetical protein